MNDTPPTADETTDDEPQELADRIEDIPAVDGATVMETLSAEQAADVAEILDPTTAGRILSRMNPVMAASVIADMPVPEASLVLAAMDPDDRVDILENVKGPVHDALMREFSIEDADEVRQLEQYPSDTAGGIMTTQVTSLPEDLTAGEAIAELRRLNETLEQMFYVYVVDGRRHLVGVLSMRDLILSHPDKKLNQIMRPNVTSVPAHMDQEEVARIVQRNKYLAMPVVDARHRLVGLITLDDVVQVINEEATEDVQKMFGAGAEERLTSPWQFSFKKRVWWLQVNLLTAFLAAWVISRFDDVIAAIPILAAYESIVSGMGGNAGAQALAVAIRGIALGEATPGILLKVIYKELLVGLFAGLAVGLTTWVCAACGVFGYSQYDHRPLLLGFVIFLALVINHINACVTGVSIPFVMKRLGFDPAQSATILRDHLHRLRRILCHALAGEGDHARALKPGPLNATGSHAHSSANAMLPG